MTHSNLLARGLLLTGVLLGALMAGSALADPERCLACHAQEEFEGLEASSVLEALQDSAIPAHSRFAEMTEEEVVALLEALQ